MSFLNRIGELFLFRWLYSNFQSKDGQKNVLDQIERQSFYSSHNSYADNDYDWNNQSFNDFHDEQDDYDMMDDF